MAVGEEQYKQVSESSKELPSHNSKAATTFNLNLLPGPLRAAAKRGITASILLLIVSWGSLGIAYYALKSGREPGDFFALYFAMIMVPLVSQGEMVLGWFRSERNREVSQQLILVTLVKSLIVFFAVMGLGLGAAILRIDPGLGISEHREAFADQAISGTANAGLMVGFLFMSIFAFAQPDKITKSGLEQADQ